MIASGRTGLLGPLAAVFIVAAVAIATASDDGPGRPHASSSTPPGTDALPEPSPPPTAIALASPSPEPGTASPSPEASTGTSAKPPGRRPPIPWGPNVSGRCQALLPDLTGYDPYESVTVQFVDGAYVPKVQRDVFAAANGLLEVDAMLSFPDWPGPYTAYFSYWIRDGTSPEEKARKLLELDNIEVAYPPSFGTIGSAELAEVVTVAVTAPPEYRKDRFIPEVWMLLEQPMSDLDVEIFAVRYQLTESGLQGDWHRYCTYGVAFPEQEEAAILAWPEVVDVRFEVGRP